MLHAFIAVNASEILARARAKASARMFPLPTNVELESGGPLFLEQLVDRLRHAAVDTGAIAATATLHGSRLLTMGFTVTQVIKDYGDICQVVTELAIETNAPITASEFHLFNRCLDDAIASAVTEYQRRRDEKVAWREAESPGLLAHEMRNRLSAAMLAYALLRGGKVGIGGSTGDVLGRNLRALRDLINGSLAGARVEAGMERSLRIPVADILKEVEEEATLEAAVVGARLVISPTEPGLEIAVDRQILTAAIGNLLQNAFKFNRPGGQVSLRTSSTPTRVLIEVEDECGGLPPGSTEDLFRPFEQRGTNRSGLGLGLAISRRGIEAMGGTLRVRDVPGWCCVFFVDLPRAASATVNPVPHAEA